MIERDGKFVSINKSYAFPDFMQSDEHPFSECLSSGNLIDRKSSPLFSGTDSADRFAESLLYAAPDWRYRTKKVQYVVNHSGYRTKEWNDIDWAESYVMLGCSNTFGIGLAEDETIPYHLQQLLDCPVINMGYPAGSNELMLNNIATIVNKFSMPKGVIINWSGMERIRYYTVNGPQDLGSWSSSHNKDSEGNDMWVASAINEVNVIARSYYLSKAASAMLIGRTKYVTMSHFEISAHYMRADFSLDIDGKARDGWHPGPDSAIIAANKLAHLLSR